MIAQLGESLVNLDEILYITPRGDNPFLADIRFKSGATIVLSTGQARTVAQWCAANVPPPGPKPPHRGPQGPKG